MPPRLFVPSARRTGDRVVIDGDELHYVRSVLRLQPGIEVRVFNGAGSQWQATIATVARASADVVLDTQLIDVSEPRFPVTLGLSILKSSFMETAIRDSVMLGVAAIQPIVSARSQDGRDAGWTTAAKRWERIALSSARQSERLYLPVIPEPLPLATWLDQQPSADAVRFVLAEPILGAGAVDLKGLRDRAISGGVSLLVGPEGGWTPEELALARRSGFIPWTINRRVLRADAAPLAALSILFHAWDAVADPPS
ncbi:MAG: 16S rRNA (uracil(1498)-N(3))-methyltransferase [Vicinamibacterales bacterium]